MSETLEQRISAQREKVRAEQARLSDLEQSREPEPVRDYQLNDLSGMKTLSELFGEKSELILIHNMGRRCAYCTLWADGFNGMLPHFENRAAFVLASPDSPAEQQQLALSRGWKMKMVSTLGSSFSVDLGFAEGDRQSPGVSIFRKKKNGEIERTNQADFGPGDRYCSLWHLFDLLSGGPGEWQPRFQYGAKQSALFRSSTYIALQVRKRAEAVRFYTEVLGLQGSRNPAEPECEVTLKHGPVTLVVDECGPGQEEGVGKVFFEFVTNDLEKAKASVLANGCTFGRTTSGGGFIGQMVNDPFGMRFHIYQQKEST